MSNWETLFHLSSQMKHLLSDVIPEEKKEPPPYVLNSLKDLLCITYSWMEKIKLGTYNDTPIKNHLARGLVKSNEGSTTYVNINKKDTDCNSPTNSTPLSNLETDYLSEVFIKMSKEILNGRHNGHYCRPCDVTIFSVKEWENHISDQLHATLKLKFNVKQKTCDYCDLIIFASYKDFNELMEYHKIEHHSPNNVTIVKNRPKNKTNRKYLKINPFESQSTSTVFIELIKKMHSGKKGGYYCHTCDKSFEVVTEWNMHFQNINVHNNQVDCPGCFEKCESCNLVSFAVPSIQKSYKSQRICGCYFIKWKKKISVKGLKIAAQNIENSSPYNNTNAAKNESNLSSNTFNICLRFKNFNKKIHNHNLRGHFYCRPCNASLSPEEWIKHSINKKHLELMDIPKVDYWKGTCTYCSLTIIGTHDTVKYYMKFHSEHHEKVPSYDFVIISSNNSKRSRRKFRARIIPCPNTDSILNDVEEVSDFDSTPSLIKSTTNEDYMIGDGKSLCSPLPILFV